MSKNNHNARGIAAAAALAVAFCAILTAVAFDPAMLAASAASAGTDAASSVESKRSERQEVDSQLSKVRDDIEAAEYENASLSVRASDYDAAMASSEMTYNDLAATLEYFREEIAAADAAMVDAESLCAQQRELIKSRVRAIYTDQGGSAVEALLNSKGMTDFLEKLKLYDAIARHDQELFASYKSALEDYEYKKSVHESVASQTRDLAVGELSSLASAGASRAQLEAEIQSLKGDIETLDAVERELADQSKQLEAEIRELVKKAEEEAAARAKAEAEAEARRSSRAGSGAGAGSGSGTGSNGRQSYSSGAMGWPVPGHSTLSSEYGTRVHPITKVKKSHTGIDIPAPTGTAITAAKGGTVIISGTKGGYGLTVAIDHGGGIVTLYGHCSKLLAKNGQTVKQGETIAKVGSTGLSTGPHCHFEVRKNGTPVQPLGYFDRG